MVGKNSAFFPATCVVLGIQNSGQELSQQSWYLNTESSGDARMIYQHRMSQSQHRLCRLKLSQLY